MRRKLVAGIAAFLFLSETASGCQRGDEANVGGNAAYVITLHPAFDTYIDALSPEENFGSLDYLQIHKDTSHTLIQFGGSSVDDSGIYENSDLEVVSARLTTWLTDLDMTFPDCEANYEIAAITKAWTEEGATFDCPNDLDSSPTDTDCPGGT